MKLNRYITKLFGSRFPNELNEPALKNFAKLQVIPDFYSFMDEVKRDEYDYDKSILLKQYIKTNEEWRKLAWCYTVVAYGIVSQKHSMVTEIGMGIECTPNRTDITDYHNEFAYVMSAKINKYSYTATKGCGRYMKSICSKHLANTDKWQSYVMETLEHLCSNWQTPRFNLNEMGENENGYLSFFYTIKIGEMVFVFHTTERGFDVFCLLRSILMDHPTEIDEFLGEYATIFN